MTAQIKSNKAATATTIYPAGMETFVNRVLADGGVISDMQEVYAIFKAIEDGGLTSSQIVAGCGATLAYKLNGSNQVTKMYDLWSATHDFVANPRATATTIDTSTGKNLLAMPTAATLGLFAAFVPANAITLVSGAIGFIGAFKLNNPTTGTQVQLMDYEDGAATSVASLFSSPAGDGKSQIFLRAFDASQGVTLNNSKKNMYADLRILGAYRTDTHFVLSKDGIAGNSNTTTASTFYNGLSKFPSIGNTAFSPTFLFRFGLFLNGSITSKQARDLCVALGALS